MRKCVATLATIVLLSLLVIQCGGQVSAPAAPAPPAAPTTAPAAQKPAEAPKAAAPTEAPKAVAPTQAPAPKQEAPKATEAPKAAAPAAPAAAAKNLRFVWLGDLNPLWHPAGYETFGQAVVFSLIFNNLVKLDEDLKTIIPDLAEKWEVTPDAMTFTFTRPSIMASTARPLSRPCSRAAPRSPKVGRRPSTASPV